MTVRNISDSKKRFFSPTYSSNILFFLDGKAQPVAFSYCARTSTLSLEKLSLNIGSDWKVHIQ